MLRARPVGTLLILAVLVSAPSASALLPVDVYMPPPDRGDEGAEDEERSCAVAAVDEPGEGVEPFVDLAASGARVGTALGSLTLVVYPYSCTYVVLQTADPNRPLPREGLPGEGDLLPSGEGPADDALALLP